jgi:hypothetical protein
VIIAMPAFNYNLTELSEVLSSPGRENIAVVKFFQIFQSITLFIIPSVLAAWLFSEKPAEYLPVNRSLSVLTIIMVLFSVVSAIPFLNYVTELNSRLDLPGWLEVIEQKMIQMEETAAELTGLFLESNTTADLIINCIMIAILPAVGEEFLFRGVAQKLFTQLLRNSHIAIILTAFFFSFIHFQFFGFVPRFLLGLYFGYLLLWSGSIWVPVAAHLINNGLAVVYYHFYGNHSVETTIDNIGISGSSHYLVYVSVLITSMVIGMIYLRERERSASYRNLV